MPAPDDLKEEISSFVEHYASLFSSPKASSNDDVHDLCLEISQCYRPGLTMFTSGKIARFESQQEAAALIEHEMRNNITTGLGTKLTFQEIEKIDIYSATSAACWIRWTFEPQSGSEFEGKGWTFTNIYGYRAESSDGTKAGWEYVVRDHEVAEVIRVTGRSFE